jgi:hypothetical protein
MKKQLLHSILLLFIGTQIGNAHTVIASEADATYKWLGP